MTPEIEKRIKLVKAGKVPAGYKKTRIGVVPEEWRIGDLSEVLELTLREVEKPSKPYWRVGVRSWAKGTFRAYVDDPSSVDMDTLYQVKENDLVVSITFAWEHAIALATKEDDGLLVSHRFPTYVFKKNHLPIFYQKFVSQPIFKYMLELVSPGGAGRNRVLDKKNFIKLPCPILKFKEQEKIAEILAAQDRVIVLKEKLIAEKQKRKNILNQQLMSRKNRLSGYNSPWKRVCLKDCCVGDGRYGLNTPACEFKDGLPKYIRITDITEDGKYNLNSKAYADVEKYEDYVLKTDDILLVRTGSTTGKSYLYNENDGELVYAGFLIRFSINPKIVDSKFVSSVLNTSEYWKWVKVMSMRSGQPGINSTEYSGYEFEIPSDVKESQAIAKVLSAADEEISLLQKDLEQEKLKKKSLMQLLLTGLVRVSA